MTVGQSVSPAAANGRSKILLIITSLVFALWFVALLAMYFKTVYPLRHPATQPKIISSENRYITIAG